MDSQVFAPLNDPRGLQGDYKRVLVVCTAGMLRSATAQVVLSQEPFNFNVRCAGALDEYAVVPVTANLLKWADEIVYMQKEHKHMVHVKFSNLVWPTAKTILAKREYILYIKDDYKYRDPELERLIRETYCVVSGFQI